MLSTNRVKLMISESFGIADSVCYNVTTEYVNLSRKVLATDMILPKILILSFAYVTVCQKNLFKATKIGEGKIQYVETLENKEHERLLFCFFECQNNVKCLTFFYNVNSKGCILHSKTFHFRDPDKIEEGWKMYLLEDGKFPMLFYID